MGLCGPPFAFAPSGCGYLRSRWQRPAARRITGCGCEARGAHVSAHAGAHAGTGEFALMVIKVLSSHEMPPEQVEAYSEFITDALIDIQSMGLIKHDMARVSTHLACLSRLVSMLQAMDPAGTAGFLQAMVDIQRAQRLNPDSARVQKAQADYVRAHTQLIQSWELFFAATGQKVPH